MNGFIIFTAVAMALVIIGLYIDGTLVKVKNKSRSALKGAAMKLWDSTVGKLDDLIIKWKWWILFGCVCTGFGYWLHMILTSQTGAALRGTMRVMS